MIPLLLWTLACAAPKPETGTWTPDTDSGETASKDTSRETGDTGSDTSSPDTAHTADTAETDTGETDTGETDTGEPPPTLDPCFDPGDLDPVTSCDGLTPTWEGDTWADLDPTDWAFRDDLAALLSDADLQSYEDLWVAFPNSDAREDGTVWDMYSDTSYTFGDNQCGEYSDEGDCYNREHVWPQAWTGDDASAKRDLHHVVPTDGYVNNRRGDLPFGEVDDVEWFSSNDSFTGTCDHEGRTLEVFQPAREYRGDLARMMFYVSIRYHGDDDGWLDNDMVEGASLAPAAEAMLRRWHIQDPVSQKEMDRNDVVQGWQGNRNPFIDHPEWVCAITDF